MRRTGRSARGVAPIESLLDARSLAELDRALLSACESVGIGAVALWRQLEPLPSDTGPLWLPVLSRGPGELLPAEALSRAALLGVIDARLPGGAHVLRAPCLSPGCALVISSDANESARDYAVSLLQLHAAVAPALADGSSGVPAPLPDRRPED